MKEYRELMLAGSWLGLIAYIVGAAVPDTCPREWVPQPVGHALFVLSVALSLWVVLDLLAKHALAWWQRISP
jgi:hypothetical protein